MELLVRGLLDSLYLGKDFENKKTGEVKAGKWTLTFIEKVKMQEGEQLVIHKINIPTEKVHQYKDKVGEIVEVPVTAWSMNGKVGYSGV